MKRHGRPLLLSFLLFALNAYICHELFAMEFMRNLDTNEGAFVSLSRFFRDYGFTERWFPWFNVGMPIENAYQPGLPMLAALAGILTRWSVERTFHMVLAIVYCAGPVTLFWFVWDWSRSAARSFLAAFLYSLISPAEVLIPVLRVTDQGHWVPLRFYNLIHYAEDPHNLALTLLPLALLFLRRSMVRPSPPRVIAAVASCAAVVLSNAFGAVDLALGGLCIALAMRRGYRVFLLTGIAGYLLICPWLPPSLIDLIRSDQWGAHGLFSASSLPLFAALAVIAALVGLWFLSRRLPFEIDRFALLFALPMCVIPIGWFALHLNVVPQGSRYQLELEMAVCLGLGCLAAHLPWRPLVLAGIVLLGARQFVVYRHSARDLMQPLDIASTIEYKASTWIDRNLQGRRAMVAGDPEWIFNVFSNNPQMSASHDPSAPNWMQRVAVYTIYTGENAGARDTEYSIFWLKAFGNAAIYVPGPASRELYHPVVHPHKFDGVLPVLWHEEDDTVFAVPQRSPSLAHVIPPEAVVTRRPLHGLDIDPARAYVAALDDATLPLAQLTWMNPSHGIIRAPMKPGQVLSVQVDYAPGWSASSYNSPVPVEPDALGMIVIKPNCNGDCEIKLSFGISREALVCRILSALTALALFASPLYLSRRSIAPAQPQP